MRTSSCAVEIFSRQRSALGKFAAPDLSLLPNTTLTSRQAKAADGRTRGGAIPTDRQRAPAPSAPHRQPRRTTMRNVFCRSILAAGFIAVAASARAGDFSTSAANPTPLPATAVIAGNYPAGEAETSYYF